MDVEVDIFTIATPLCLFDQDPGEQDVCGLRHFHGVGSPRTSWEKWGGAMSTKEICWIFSMGRAAGKFAADFFGYYLTIKIWESKESKG